MPSPETFDPRRRAITVGLGQRLRHAFQEVQSERPNESIENLGRALKRFLEETREGRRNVLIRGGRAAAATGAGIALAYPVVDALVEMAWQREVYRESSEIGWATDQEDRLAKVDSMVICLPGTGIGKGNGNAEHLLPELQKIGAVGYVDYSTEGLKPREIAEKILKIKEEHQNIKKFSIYGHSTGALVFGRVLEAMEEMGRRDDLALDYMFMDCVPPDISHLTEPALASLVALANGEGTATFAGIENYVLYGDPLYPAGTTPRLFADQLRVMWRGKEALQKIVEKADRDGTTVVSLRPKDTSKDPAVDNEKSEKTLKDMFGDDRLFVYRLEGDQGHGNPDKNTEAYLTAIAQAISLREI